MMLYASSCERPSKSSARVFLPSSVSNVYSFSTATQGRSRRLFLISSFRSACSASSLASSSRAACHSSWVPTLCSGISSPSRWLGRYRDHEMRLEASVKLIAPVLEPQAALTTNYGSTERLTLTGRRGRLDRVQHAMAPDRVFKGRAEMRSLAIVTREARVRLRDVGAGTL